MSWPPHTDRRIAAPDGLMLFCRDVAGDETRLPVVCLPGLTRNHRDFAPLVPHLAPKRRVLCIDMRGRGGSDRDPDPSHYNAMTEAKDVLAVLDALGIPRAVFLGTSRGGIQTMLLALIARERIAGAVLNDIGPRLDMTGLARIVASLGVTPDGYADWPAATAAVRAANESQLPGLTDEEWLAMARALMVEQNGRVIFDYDPALAAASRIDPDKPAPEMWEAFEALAGAPLLAIRGGLSDLLSAGTLGEMQTRIPAMHTLTLPHRGHVPFLDEPAAVAAIEALLDEADRS
jgi:pimeloyl-ACP methyl ester carboxylesterase